MFGFNALSVAIATPPEVRETLANDTTVLFPLATPKSEPNLKSAFIFPSDGTPASAKRESDPTKQVVSVPRTTDLPKQSPKYWVKEKDRYLRQMLIADIEALTSRPLVVYFAQLDEPIGHTDPDDLSEILSGIPDGSIDLFIQTPGGNIDATEKIISILKQRTKSYRVVVPSWAKSAGTVLALSSEKIVLGVNSELGPIDPQWPTSNGMVPGELIASDPSFPQHIRDLAKLSVERNRRLAKQLLMNGMMQGKNDTEIDKVLAKISSSNGYLSHGAVIDHSEALSVGLSVLYLPPDDELWRRVWLLYCLYEYDSKQNNLGRMFEGSSYSISRPKAAAPTPKP